MEKKVFRAMVGIVAIILLVLSIALATQLLFMRSQIVSSNDKTGKAVGDMSSSAFEKEIKDNLLTIAKENATDANNYFQSFENVVRIMADAINRMYENKDKYGDVKVELPDEKNADILTNQVTYSKDTDFNSPEIQKELGLIGNLQELLWACNNNNDKIASVYYATESGLMIQSDKLSGEQFDENGKLKNFEAKERPWYKGAINKNGLFMTDPVKDNDTGNYAVMCSIPYYENNKIMGVAAAGMYLSDFDKIVKDATIGDTGSACIMDNKGDVVFSSRKTGSLATGETELNNVLETGDEQLKALVKRGLAGNADIELVKLDGEDVYISYAPLQNTRWIILSILPEDTVKKPTNDLLSEIDSQNSALIASTDMRFVYCFISLIVVLVLSVLVTVWISGILAEKLAGPIVQLTRNVKAIEGDALDFEWNRNTNDEIQSLAEAFSSLTDRIKKYIVDITAITAEKERIGAELSVATQIQADMLPTIFPPFPERDEFDIYASMNPAKEVGGDFYDFFMLDNNRVAMVMADVSGKGVPAALFMVISKTLIKNQTQFSDSPKEILETVNNQLCENNKGGMFVTVWLGIMDIATGKIKAANAGHEYPAIRKANGEFELFKDKHGIVLGGMEDMVYKEYEFEVEEGGCLFLYTDGVPEATSKDEELFGTDRMLKALNEDPLSEPEILLKTVRRHVDEFVGDAPQFDDLTMLAMVRRN